MGKTTATLRRLGAIAAALVMAAVLLPAETNAANPPTCRPVACHK